MRINKEKNEEKMKHFAENYYQNLAKLIELVEVGGKSVKAVKFYQGIYKAADLINSRVIAGNKLIFIGNGASASISSHQATDFWKNGGMRAIAFNDAALLTCVSNDIGYPYVFEKSIEMFADKGDVLVAISSSGKSENILRGIKAAVNKGCKIITLSGFKNDNPLRLSGDINFYVPSLLYGHVEIFHHSICHCILEYLMQKTTKQNRECRID
ncbi:MAG: SIS domain-containing protein [Elusimicrobiota bacterium]